MSGQMDIVNEQDEPIGHADKDEIHKKWLLHRAVHIFIINSQGKLFCRMRSLQKPVYPGYWSTSVGSHVMSGQTYDHVARKSLQKDLGINCRLEMIGKARVRDQWENEISATYIGYSDESMALNQEQIEEGKFLSIQEIKKLTKQKNATPHLAHSLKLYIQHKNAR